VLLRAFGGTSHCIGRNAAHFCEEIWYILFDGMLICAGSQPGRGKPSTDARQVFVCFDSGRTMAAESIEAWFSKAGEIEGVTLPSALAATKAAEGGDGFSFVLVTFTSEADADRAAALRWKPLHGSVKRRNRWLEAFESDAVAPADLQSEANRTIASFETAEAAEEERIKAMEGVPDDDGFITVTRKTADRSFESKNLKKKRKLAAEGKVGGGGLQLGPFYKFQIRESKRNRTLVLPLSVKQAACDT
jgi:Ribosomal RNA-processing protein 7 (RRP7) C-terminal domain